MCEGLTEMELFGKITCQFGMGRVGDIRLYSPMNENKVRELCLN